MASKTVALQPHTRSPPTADTTDEEIVARQLDSLDFTSRNGQVSVAVEVSKDNQSELFTGEEVRGTREVVVNDGC